MDTGSPNDLASRINVTALERKSDRELVASRVIKGPARLVFKAWTRPELFTRWWAPKASSIVITSCELDVRTGGSYRLEVTHPSLDHAAVFFGRYVEVVPPSRIVWTNEEGGGDGPITTVTFEESEGETLIVVHELFPSKQALDEAIASESVGAWDDQLAQLDAFVRSGSIDDQPS